MMLNPPVSEKIPGKHFFRAMVTVSYVGGPPSPIEVSVLS